MSLRSAKLALPASALALLAAAAQAQDIDSIRQTPGAEGQGGGIVGLGVASGPRYAGSSDTRTRVLPVLGYQWANGWFARWCARATASAPRWAWLTGSEAARVAAPQGLLAQPAPAGR
jgi:outer membrane scaffolding protein for murein synthesis (MipA/OmpV family)